MNQRIESAAESPLEMGFRICRQESRNRFGDFGWTIRNVSSETKRHLHNLMSYYARAMDLLNEPPASQATADACEVFSDGFREAIQGRCPSAEYEALMHTMEACHIPKQFLFDPIVGIESLLRRETVESYEELLQFGGRIGGSIATALVYVLGYTHDNFVEETIRFGQAVALTELIGRVCCDDQHRVFYLPGELARQFDCDLEDSGQLANGRGFVALVRWIGADIENRFFDSGDLVNKLELDAQRILNSLASYYWRLLVQLKRNPTALLQHSNELSATELRKLKFKFWLGFEGGSPFVSNVHGAH